MRPPRPSPFSPSTASRCWASRWTDRAGRSARLAGCGAGERAATSGGDGEPGFSRHRAQESGLRARRGGGGSGGLRWQAAAMGRRDEVARHRQRHRAADGAALGGARLPALPAGRVSRRRRPRGGAACASWRLASSSPGHMRRHAGPSPRSRTPRSSPRFRPRVRMRSSSRWARRARTSGSRGILSLRVPVSVGVGGAFNFLAGETRRAPLWMQRLGLEWAHRLISEPARLWRRYLIDDLPLAALLLLAAQPAPAATSKRRSRSAEPGGARCHLTSLAWI